MEELAPIVLFVYARPEHTKKTIEKLSKNNLAKESNIWIFSDNYKDEKSKKNVEKVREYINTIKRKEWFKSVTIVESPKNQGLASSVIKGVTEVINKFGKIIVLEDDLITSKYYIQYMNEALNFYANDKTIWSISGYNIPIDIPKEYKNEVYLGYRGCSWGWGTWKDRWNTVDWEVKDYNKFKHNIKKRNSFNRGGPDMAQVLDAQMKGLCDSWAIRWCYEQSKQNKYTIYPIKSLVINQGLDGSGTHSGNDRSFDVILNDKLPKLEKNLVIDEKISKNFYNKFNHGYKQKIREILTIIRLDSLIKVLKRKK